MSKTPVDKHILYEASVQDPGVDISLIERIFGKAGLPPPQTLREDFCGTAWLACAWVESDPEREAWGVDLDRPTLDWAEQHRRSALGGDAERVHLFCEDVLHFTGPNVDVVAALNFSYMIFKQRHVLKAYFQSVYDDLNDHGVFLLDVFGGPNAQDTMRESKEVPAGEDYQGTPYPDFKYVWDQASFNAVDQNIVCHIHFKGKEIESIRNAFTYDWRLWSITEITDLLHEVGFSRVDPYFEGWSDKDNDTDGVLRVRKRYEGMMAWISYLAAHKTAGT
jgi:cyclopropane fatty-acyl-phospholipid synthase-like methyltransferase